MTSDVALQKQRIRVKQKMLQAQQGGAPVPRGGLFATTGVAQEVGPGVAQRRFDAEQSEQARLEQQLGAPFSRTGEFDDSFLGRMGLATQEGEEEKALRLQAKNPDFDVRTIQANEGKDPLTVFRRPGEEQFQAIDTPGGSFSSDVADVIGSLGNLENLLSIVGTKGTGGLLTRLLTSGAGALVGNEADAQIEKAQGFELADGRDRLLERTFATGGAAGGEVLGGTATTAKQLAKGERGLVKPNPRSEEAIRIVAENPELENLSAGQVSPVFKRKENQTAQTGNAMLDFRERQQGKLAQSIRDTAPPAKEGDRVFSDQSLIDINEQTRRATFEELGETPGSEAVVRQAGRDLQTARQSLVETKRAEKNQLFDDAFAQATPDIKFDISEAQVEAADALKGVRASGKDKITTTDPVDTGLLDEAGKPIIKEGEEVVEAGKDVRLATKFTGPMKSALDDLSSLKSTIESENPKEAFDQIKALRTQFFDLKQPNPQTGTFTQEARIASRIYNKLTDALKNPAGGSDEFVSAFGAASKANVDFENLVNTRTLKEIAKSENPQQLFSRIVTDGNFEQLTLLKNELKPQEFRQLGSAFDEFLRADPKSINKTLDKFARDQDSLRTLITKKRENQLRVLGNAAERLDNAPSVKVLKSTGDAGERALKIMEGGSEEQFKAFIDSAVKLNSANEKDTKAALLHGVVTKILDKHRSIKDGRTRYNMNKIATELQGLIETGRLKQIADPRTLRALKDRSYIASVLGASEADVGASLSGASVASEAVSINPAEAVGGFLGVAHNEIWARVLTHPGAVRLLAGTGKQTNPAVDKSIQGVSRLLGIAADDINRAPQIDFKDEDQDEN